MAKVTSVRLQDELADKLDALATSIDRPRAWIIEQAIKSYVDEQSWQIDAVRQALEDYRSGNVKLVPHDQVMEHIEARVQGKLSE